MIRIVARLRPFSHLPKTRCLIPGTGQIVEAYPNRILLKNLETTDTKEILLNIQGPLNHFTVIQDLEKGYVMVFSEKYQVYILPNGQIHYRTPRNFPLIKNREILSFGMHKKQDWELIRKRLDFREIFPIWFRLGALLDLSPRKGVNQGMYTLLAECKEAIAAHQPEYILHAFKKLFLAGFGGLFVPRLIDEDYHGILPEPSSLSKGSPLYLLTEGADLIRSLFLTLSGNKIFVLPNLPPDLFAGRLTGFACQPYGEIDLEWSKKTIRRLVFRATCEGEITFCFSSSIRSYRLKVIPQKHGETRTTRESLEIKLGKTYLLDQFQK
ncbi:MAG: hypothetical protein R3E91_01255 [Chlamydiales bacterium]